MPLPTHDAVELERWVKHIVTRWLLEHGPDLTIIQGVCLGIPLTREDYFRVVREFVDRATENKNLGKGNQRGVND